MRKTDNSLNFIQSKYKSLHSILQFFENTLSILMCFQTLLPTKYSLLCYYYYYYYCICVITWDPHKSINFLQLSILDWNAYSTEASATM